MLAMDDSQTALWRWASSTVIGDALIGNEAATGFHGFPLLALLSQLPEYRRVSEVISTEMTRKWVKLKAVGNADKTEKINQLEEGMRQFKVREVFEQTAKNDGLFGRGHIYINLGNDDPQELLTDIGDGTITSPTSSKLGKGGLAGFRSIEPMWVYPMQYESTDPLKDNWYRPETWMVMTRQIHRSRLLTVVGREVPDILKPAYAFAGVSLSQMIKPYVDRWLRTVKSVSDFIHSYSVFILKTNLFEKINGDKAGLIERMQLFVEQRDNTSLLAIDKNLEDFTNVSATIAGLSDLQAQSQEQICSITGIPLVKYTGISPKGLNASSEGELRSFYDWIKAFQERLFRDPLTIVLRFIMIHLWGAVDEEITFDFEELWSLDEKSQAEVEKTKADTDGVLIDKLIIDRKEARTRLAGDPDSSYNALSDMPASLPPPVRAAIQQQLGSLVAALFESGVILKPTALQMLQQLGLEIPTEEIVEAENEPPPPDENTQEAPEQEQQQAGQTARGHIARMET